MGLKHIFFGYALAMLTFISCGAAGYKYYVPELPNTCYDNGKLLGPDSKDDRSFAMCKPDSQRKVRCVVMEFDEMLAAKNEIKYLRGALKHCQKGSTPQ